VSAENINHRYTEVHGGNWEFNQSFLRAKDPYTIKHAHYLGAGPDIELIAMRTFILLRGRFTPECVAGYAEAVVGVLEFWGMLEGGAARHLMW